MNRPELMSRIAESREQLEAILARFSDERKLLVILHGEWSVKDLIGHLGFWENRAVSLFELLKKGASPEPFRDIDMLNDQALTEMRSLSLADVQLFEKAAYQKMLALLNNASDQELFDPDHFAWTAGQCFEGIVSDNSWGHYDEHLPELTQWLKRIA